MKKTLITLFSLVLLGSFGFAEYEKKQVDDSYQTIDASYLNFNATLSDGKVEMSWDADALVLANSETWQYWKVLRSQKTDNPLYPDLGAIKYSPDTSFKSHTDWDVKAGTTYYRVCAISYDTRNNRHCSNVVAIESDGKSYAYKEVEKKYVTKKEHIAKHTGLSIHVKAQIDVLFVGFMKKLKEKYNGDQDAMLERLERIAIKIESKTPSSQTAKDIFAYFGQKIQQEVDELQPLGELAQILSEEL